MEKGIGGQPDICEATDGGCLAENRKTADGGCLAENREAPKGGCLAAIREAFGCRISDIRSYSPLTLAYIGDAVYDLVIRSVVVERGNRAVNLLHRSAVKYVNAGAQARMIEELLESLTQEENDIYRRGRNAKSHTAAKNAAIEDYRKATGMEALIGYLYLTDRFERILELVKLGLEKTGMKI